MAIKALIQPILDIDFTALSAGIAAAEVESNLISEANEANILATMTASGDLD